MRTGRRWLAVAVVTGHGLIQLMAPPAVCICRSGCAGGVLWRPVIGFYWSPSRHMTPWSCIRQRRCDLPDLPHPLGRRSTMDHECALVGQPVQVGTHRSSIEEAGGGDIGPADSDRSSACSPVVMGRPTAAEERRARQGARI